MGDYDDAITAKELNKANRQCRRGVSDKDTPVDWELHSMLRCRKLKKSIVSGKYKPRRGVKVQIYRPKRRTAHAPFYGDRVWQQAMCNNGVYRDLTKSAILDNYACQKGKGTDLAIRRVVKALQTLHRMKPGEPVYGIHLDIKSYFPSTPHRVTKEHDRRVIHDKRYIPYLDDVIDNTRDERPTEEIAADPYGERGTGLGSRINQLNQVSLLSDLDHELKTFCRFYFRYNDDFLIIDHDKAVIKQSRAVIEDHLVKIGLKMTVKEEFKAEHGFCFLRKRFILTKTGKVIIRLHKKALADERKALRKLKRDLDAGLTDMEHVKAHYQSIVAYFEYAGDAPIRAMDRYYTELFRRKPEYKRKKRYLYGQRNNTEGKAVQSGSRERETDSSSRKG